MYERYLRIDSYFSYFIIILLFLIISFFSFITFLLSIASALVCPSNMKRISVRERNETADTNKRVRSVTNDELFTRGLVRADIILT